MRPAPASQILLFLLLSALTLGVTLLGTGTPLRAQEKSAPLAPEEPGDDASIYGQKYLAKARSRYSSARLLYASFEGTMSPYGKPLPISGTIAYRAPDAVRYELVHGAGEKKSKTTHLVQDGRVQRRQESPGQAPVLTEEEFQGSVSVPLIPAFDIYDESTVTVVDHKYPAPRRLVVVVEARLKSPGEAFAAARLGIEDRTWVIRTLDLLGADGAATMAIRFDEVRLDAPLPEGIFAPLVPR